jgi:hypothetical protein
VGVKVITRTASIVKERGRERWDGMGTNKGDTNKKEKWIRRREM